jgi:predicted deacylase
MNREFEIEPQTPASKGRDFHWLDVTTRLDGTVLRIPLHVITGSERGPTLTLTSTLHGGEWLSIEVFRRLVQELDPGVMRGKLLVIPVANPHAFQNLTRNTPDESDEADLNRSFPGGDTWLTLQIAREITGQVLSQTNYLIDFHLGPWGSALADVNYGQDIPDEETRGKAATMARAFGFPCIRRLNLVTGFPGPRSIAAYAAVKLGIPAVGTGIGGSGFDPGLEERWIETSVTGIRNVMMHLGMLDGTPDIPSPYLTFQGRGHRVAPSVGGYLHPIVSPDSLLKEVHKGEMLARVMSPYTFEELEVLRSPVNGVLFGVARPYPVQPGDWAYFVADLDDPETRWVEESR